MGVPAAAGGAPGTDLVLRHAAPDGGGHGAYATNLRDCGETNRSDKVTA